MPEYTLHYSYYYYYHYHHYYYYYYYLCLGLTPRYYCDFAWGDARAV